MPDQQTVLKAVQAVDTEDFLQHIAWTDIILPSIEKAKKALTERLVAAVLNAPSPLDRPSETREQLAGKLYGLDFITNTFNRIIREGTSAKDALARENYFLQQ